METFKDKIAVVTGGAQGIGRCIADEFLKAGAHVCVIDKQEGQHFVGDISDKQVLDRFVQEVIEKHGHVDYLINNALPLMKGIDECSYEEFQYAMSVGVTAPFYLAKLFTPHFAEGAAIVNISSSRDLLHLAYLPIVQLHEPKQTLASDAAQHLIMKMREIIGYLHSNHIYKGEVLRMLYSIFLLDLQNAQNSAIVHRQTPQRVEEIFIGFIRLLPSHFAEHHDIAFYADRLHITPVYLSRVVRQVTGRTVVDYINQMLLMEATFLLQTSQLSITQIADHLHFADTPSFSKFFSRLKGMSPKEYRKSPSINITN